MLGNLLDRVHLRKTRVLEQTEPSNTEDGVEHVYHVTRSVCEASQLGILQALETGFGHFQMSLLLTWHRRMKEVSFSPSIQCNLFSMARLLITHQL